MASLAEVAGGLMTIKESTTTSTVAGDSLTQVLVKHFAKEFYMYVEFLKYLLLELFFHILNFFLGYSFKDGDKGNFNVKWCYVKVIIIIIICFKVVFFY